MDIMFMCCIGKPVQIRYDAVAVRVNRPQLYHWTQSLGRCGADDDLKSEYLLILLSFTILSYGLFEKY